MSVAFLERPDDRTETFPCLDAADGFGKEGDKELWFVSNSPSWDQGMQSSPTLPSVPPAPVRSQPTP